MKMRKTTVFVAGIMSMLLLVSCNTAAVPVIAPESAKPVQTTALPEQTSAPSESPSETIDSSLAYFVNEDTPQKPAYYNAGRTQYDISVTYNEKKHSAEATQTVEYTNNTPGELKELYMHIYPNHFSKKKFVEMNFGSDEGEGMYPHNRFNPGFIKFSSIKAAGAPVDFEIEGDDLSVLRIPLAQPLKKGESVRLDLEYKVQIPQRIGCFAWSDIATGFANWYPIMAVYDEDGWNLDLYYEVGDPFYSETADYKVTIDMPEGFEAAFTGDIISDKSDNGRRVLALAETGVRDFAFVLSSDFVIETQTIDGIQVNAAVPKANKDMADDAAAFAVKAISYFDKLFGKYTNDSFSVVFTDMPQDSGMEYPGIVILDADILNYDTAGGMLEQIIAHETAHQWWYSAVGNNEIDEGWLDESLTCFSTEVYFSNDERNFSTPVIQPKNSLKLDMSLPEFGDWEHYFYVYQFGPSFYKSLMAMMGKEPFYKMLREYYGDYAYGIATAENLRTLVKAYGNETALKWFDQCVYGMDTKQ